MRKRNGRIFIILGGGLALIAVMLSIVSFVGNGKSGDNSTANPETVAVIQAGRDIAANSVVREDDIKTVQVQKSQVSPGAAGAVSQVVGLATSGNIVKGQQILAANLQTPGLTNVLGQGMRAVALPISRADALGGLINAEDYIDVIYSTSINLASILPTNVIEASIPKQEFSFDSGTLSVPPADQTPGKLYPFPGEDGSRFLVTDGQNGNPVTKVMLQNIRVVRVIAGSVALNGPDLNTSSTSDTSGDATKTPAPTSTDKKSNATGESLPDTDMLVLEVDPQQLELLKFLEDNQGHFQVALRGANDHTVNQTTGITYDKLVTDYALTVPKSVRMPGGDR